MHLTQGHDARNEGLPLLAPVRPTIAHRLAARRTLLLLSPPCLAYNRLIVLRLRCHALPPPTWGGLTRPIVARPILVLRLRYDALPPP